MTDRGAILFVDDDKAMRSSTTQWLALSGFDVADFPGGPEVLPRISPDFAGIVVTDVKMPRMTGLELLERITAIDPDLPVVIITGHGDVSMAVEAMRLGAYDFIEKPFEPERLIEVADRACEKRRLVMENRTLRRRLSDGGLPASRLIGASPAIETLHQEILDVADTDASVLILGETGSGKEVAARCLHDASSRSGGNFVALNCGAIPESVFESELFGHESGAFTGAHKRRIGKFEHADGGTLFLDEIGSMPPSLQVKVLRALQERVVERLGSNQSIPVDIRVIAASNDDLREACRTGTFREDLYYRLNVVELRMPPLRERGGDVLALFDHFVSQAAERYGREAPPLPDEAAGALMAHDWPGNVRELKNAAERFVLSSQPPMQRLRAILGAGKEGSRATTGDGRSLADQVQDFERHLLERALGEHRGNIAAVMEGLVLPRRTLNQKMAKHGLDRKDFV